MFRFNPGPYHDPVLLAYLLIIFGLALGFISLGVSLFPGMQDWGFLSIVGLITAIVGEWYLRHRVK